MTADTDKIDLTGIERKNLCRILAEFGMKPFRGKQVFQWIHKQRELAFENMTNLSREDQLVLGSKAFVRLPRLVKHLSASDGTEKFLYGLADGHTVEGVLIPEDQRRTLCVSTQVGCAMGCTFCTTGKTGFIRNLTASEIVGQILLIQGIVPADAPVTHLVIMGMGEPLANYESTLCAIRILLDPVGEDFSRRKITLSTCGLIPGIQRLASEAVRINLAVSLNASDSSSRDRIMPINRKYPLSDLLRVLKSYPLAPRSRITFEYVLIRGVNDSLEDAKRLTRILKGIRCKINLIPCNPISEGDFRSPSKDRIDAFQAILLAANYTVMIRESRGQEISAACGQLRERQDNDQASVITDHTE